MPSCLARSMPAWESVQRCLFVPQLPLAKMFVACPGPSWPAVPPCGLPARGRECRASRPRVQMRVWSWDAVYKLASLCGVVALIKDDLLRRLPPRRLPLGLLRGAIHSAGQQMSDEAKRVRVVERPEKATIKAFVNSPGPFALANPSFLVVSGAQGTGKTTMLKSLFAEYHDDGRWVLPVSQDIDPGSKLDLKEVVRQALRTSGGPLIVYLQLSTKNRGVPFTDDQCDSLGTEIGAFGRKLTYDYPLCKLVVELSVSLIADKIQERLGQDRASRVLPRCCNSG